jgi:hypothetical protein
VKSLKGLKLNTAQQKNSEMEANLSRYEAEILRLRKERDTAEHKAVGLMKIIMTAEKKNMELEKERDMLEWRFVSHFNPISFSCSSSYI